MNYNISNQEIELLLSFYRNIQKYNDLLKSERNEAHYGIDSEIFAAFKLIRVTESTKFSYISDYCRVIKKAMKSWENAKGKAEYRSYRAVQLMFLGKRSYTQAAIENKIGCPKGDLRRCCLDRGIETFKMYLFKHLSILNYTQTDMDGIDVNKGYQFEYDRNLEILFYVTSSISRQYKKFFMDNKLVSIPQTGIHRIKPERKKLKEVS